MVDYTPILRLVQPDFDQTPWDEDVNNNFAILDATYGKFAGIEGLTGAWKNTTAYLTGQSAVDIADSTLWKCVVSHTSAASPTTFAQDRAAHPSYWSSLGALLLYLPITGGTLTGNLGIQQPVGSTCTIVGYKGTVPHWSLILGNGSVASDFAVSRFSDAGVYLDSPIYVARSNGTIALAHQTTVSAPLTASQLASSSSVTGTSFNVTSSGAYITGDANYTLFVQDASLWRWQYSRVNGLMQYVRGPDNTQLLGIDGVGGLTVAGGISAGGALSAASLTATYIHSTGGFMSDVGAYYFSGSINYYIARQSDAHWRIAENNNIIFDLTPSGTLAVPGNILPRNGLSNFGTGGSGVILQFSSSWYFDWNSSDGTLSWTTPIGALMSIDGTGNFAVNGRVSCNDIVNNSGVFFVGGDPAYYVGRSSGDGHWRWVENSITNMELDTAGSLACKMNVSAGFDIIAGGTGRKPGGGSWDVPSDLRLKQDVVDYTSGLAIINQLQPIEFSYLPETGFDTTLRHVGLAAQDIQDIMPNAVKSVPVADMPEAGKDLAKSVDDVLVVNHNELLFALVNAVKELQARIVELENAP